MRYWSAVALMGVSACGTPPSRDVEAVGATGIAAMDSLVASAAGTDSTAAPLVVAAVDTTPPPLPSLADIGYRDGVTLTGSIDRTTLAIPVAAGLTPRDLVLAVLPTPRMPDATVVVRQGGRILAQRAITDTTTTVVMPLADAIVQHGQAIIDLGVDIPGRDACEAPLFYRTVFTPGGAVHYDGTPDPVQSISGFFAPWLRRVTFYLPAEPSLDAAQAALDAAAFVARHYRGMSTTFAIGRLPEDGSPIVEPPADERALVWATDGPTRLLRPDNGRGTVLALASRRDARQLFTLADGPSLVPVRAFATTAIRIDSVVRGTVSLDALGIGSRTVQGSAIASAGYRFALADFGYRAAPAAFRLVADHATLPRETSGEVSLLLNGAIIWSRPLDQNRIDVTIPLPASLLTRENDLEVRFLVRLGSGDCHLGAPLFSATIFGESAFVLGHTDRFPPSFDRFPSALVPTFSVVLEPRDRFRVELAADLIGAMQQTTRQPLAPFVVRDAAEARGAVLAVGTPALAEQLDAPVASDGFRLRDLEGRVWDEYRTSDPFAVMQAYQAGGRDVLMLHHTGSDGQPLAALVRETLAPYGWFGVHGDLALRGPDGPAVTVTAANSGWRLEPIGAAADSFFARWRTVLFTVAGLLILGLVIWFYPRMVRRELDSPR
jgi:hypothetical protein